MSRFLVITIGFTERFIIRTITHFDIEEGDGLLLIIAKPITDQVARIIAFVKDFISKYIDARISLNVMELDMGDSMYCVSKIK